MTTPQLEYETTLPIGYADETGAVHRRVLLRKLRGHEEALLHDPSIPAGRLVTEVIRNCIVRLGDLESVDAPLVSDMYCADRNYLLLELRRITLGDALRGSYRCPHCGKAVFTEDDLKQLRVRRLEPGEEPADVTLTLADGYVDRGGTHHVELTMRLPRGADEEFVAPMLDSDPVRAQDVLFLRCIKQFGSVPKAELEAYGVKILRDLTLADRYQIQAALTEHSPGVDFWRNVRCDGCDTLFAGVLDITFFFSALN